MIASRPATERTAQGMRYEASARGSTPAPFVLGVAGTAKNTGKTTTMAGIMQEGLARGWRMCLTSIGFDGEELDNVTGLPKPRIHCEEGVVVATASRCVEAGTAAFGALEDAGIDTALGRVLIGEVRRRGLVVLAGPNKTIDLEALLGRIRGMRATPDLVLVDGAFGRIAPMTAVDAIVIATGGSRNRSIPALARDTEAIVRVFGIPSLDDAGWAGLFGEVRPSLANGAGCGETLVSYKDGRVATAPGSCLLGDQAWAAGGLGIAGIRAVFAAGATDAGGIRSFVRSLQERLGGVSLVFSSPISLMVSGDPVGVATAIDWVESGGGRVWVRRPVPLLAITVNPFYPVRLSSGNFAGRFVNRKNLLREFKRRLGVPVWDVVSDRTAGLGEQVASVLQRRRPVEMKET
ncbi:MAG: hypothetical protein HPY55_09860 [Firmicutes bacterium]|nr:hypothetical protein [Bacillota bacterium]